MEPDYQTFLNATIEVIKNFEGGYFHPDMYQRNKTKFKLYGTSGETLFGLDRHAGHGIYYSSKKLAKDVQTNLKYIPGYTFKNPQSKEFWTTIDNAGARSKWSWGYRGGNLEDRLTLLAAQVMYPEFLKYSNTFLNDQEKEIVYKDPRLMFHFIYATWNGPGFFQKWANKLKEKLKTTKDSNVLVDTMITARKNDKYPQIRRSGSEMAELFNKPGWTDKLIEKTQQIVQTVKKQSKKGPTVLFIGLILIGTYFFF